MRIGTLAFVQFLCRCSSLCFHYQVSAKEYFHNIFEASSTHWIIKINSCYVRQASCTFRSSYTFAELRQMQTYLITTLTFFSFFFLFFYVDRKIPALLLALDQCLLFLFVFLSGTVSLEGVCKGMSDSPVDTPFFRCLHCWLVKRT